MKREELIQLAEKISNGLATDVEISRYNSWYNSLSLGEMEWEEAQLGSKDEKELVLLQAIHTDIRKLNPTKPNTIKLWPRIAVAAAAVAAITLGVWLYYASSINGRHSDAGQNPGLAMNDIAPGKNTATLTLASGQVIHLDTNKSSVTVTDSVKTTTMLTASTPRGGTYQVVLPDGTRVWLNADSKISFPSQFNGKERKILMNGEAYFEVTKNKDMPFIVQTNDQTVTVLGTHFNVNSYGDEQSSTITSLLEGSVELSNETATRKLKPGEQGIGTVKGIMLLKGNAADAIAWKNGEFIFNDEPLESIMLKLARWYDVEVIYDGADPKALFYGSMSRYDNISKVLSKLELTGGIHFKIEGRNIIVTK